LYFNFNFIIVCRNHNYGSNEKMMALHHAFKPGKAAVLAKLQV